MKSAEIKGKLQAKIGRVRRIIANLRANPVTRDWAWQNFTALVSLPLLIVMVIIVRQGGDSYESFEKLMPWGSWIFALLLILLTEHMRIGVAHVVNDYLINTKLHKSLSWLVKIGCWLLELLIIGISMYITLK